MKNILLFILIALCIRTSTNAQSIVVNRIYNATSTSDGRADAVELLVIEDSLDIRNFIIKDFETNLTTDTGGKYQFKNIALWQNLLSGTTIVLRRIASLDANYVEDTDPSDFTIDLLFENTTYISNIAVIGHKFNITNTDMVVIKTGSMDGVANAIHSFATNNGGPTALFLATAEPKLVSSVKTETGAFQYPINPTLTVSDYSGTGKTASTFSGDRNWGYGFGAGNIAYISALRNAHTSTAPGNLVATPVSGKEISLSWEDNSDNEQSFEIERSDNGIDFIRIATVNANAVSFTDRELLGSTQYNYRIRSTGTPDYSVYSNTSSATTLPFNEVPQLSAQAVHPNFFGINYWYPGNSLPFLKEDLQQAGMKIVRIGGNEFNLTWLTATNYNAAIEYVRSMGAEPLLQIPIGLTENEVSDWIDYFNNVQGYEIKYWAIGNEPDPANSDSTPYNDPLDWSAGTLSNSEGYTYQQWEAQFLRLAERIKTHQPRAIIVGGDLRLFYSQVIDNYYTKFIASAGDSSHNGVPLLDYFSFHYYGFDTEAELDTKFGKVKALVDNINQHRVSNGFPELRIAITEVNTATWDPPFPWEYRAGQFIALMQKKAMQEGALAVIPWSIYESGGNEGDFDYSLYNTDRTRRSTMWHVAMLSNNRKDNIMSGQMMLPNSDVAFIAMRDATGYTVMIMNLSVSNTYSYRASLDNTYHGTEQVSIKLEGYAGITGEFSDIIWAETTHLYRIDASGNIISRLTYSIANMANNEGPVEEIYDTWTGKYFYVINKFSTYYLWPKANSATTNIAQKANPDLNSEFIQWFFEPASTPEFYYIMNRATGKAIRPAGGMRGFLIEQIILDSITRTDQSMMWAIIPTPEEGYSRLQNKASGKYLNPKVDKSRNAQSIVQSVLVESDSSFIWKLQESEQIPAGRLSQSARLATINSEELTLNNSTRIYPNPVTSTFVIENKESDNHIILTNTTGQVFLKQVSGPSTKIDMITLPKGVYILTISNENERVIRRIIKQ